jgi:malonate-semialdehyde dehydrogenase (acetylating)/methylmalonate-semialdehyde dehydrogenase
LAKSVCVEIFSLDSSSHYLRPGINVPIPVPLPVFSWSGNKASVLGGYSLYGDLGLNFWLQNKVSQFNLNQRYSGPIFAFQTITSSWKGNDSTQSKADVAMPTQR